jgi:enoyl-CoA hydratase
MTRQLVDLRISGGVAHVVLDDPARRNVLSPPMVQGLADAYDAAEAGSAVNCVVLSARGKAFCAGAELAVLEAAASGDYSGIEDVYRGFLRVARSSLPTIAVVDGPAVGAGFNLALACDLRIASAGALFDARFTTLRLLPGGGHAWLLEQAVGRQAATAITLFGERLDAAAAQAAGLVWRVCREPDEAAETALALAGRLGGLDREFVTSLTGLLRDAGSQSGHAQAIEHERFLQRWSVTQPAFLAGVRAMRAAVDRR